MKIRILRKHDACRLLLLSVLLPIICTSCHTLRKIQSSRHTDSVAVDHSDIHKTVTEVAKEQGTIVQTIVEYYPPVAVAPTEPSAPAPATTTRPPAIKRIIHTEIATGREQAITTDSTVHNDIATHVETATSDKIVEKPPASTLTVKWVAIGLIALLMIFILIKFRRFL